MLIHIGIYWYIGIHWYTYTSISMTINIPVQFLLCPEKYYSYTWQRVSKTIQRISNTKFANIHIVNAYTRILSTIRLKLFQKIRVIINEKINFIMRV